MRSVLASAVAIGAMTVLSNGLLAAEEISIVVSPNIINIESAAAVVTVHTDIPYSAVVGSSVYLDSVEISSWKADSRGYFVAKFLAEEVKGIVEVGETVTLTLKGVTISGKEFSGSDAVKVIEVKAKK